MCIRVVSAYCFAEYSKVGATRISFVVFRSFSVRFRCRGYEKRGTIFVVNLDSSYYLSYRDSYEVSYELQSFIEIQYILSVVLFGTGCADFIQFLRGTLRDRSSSTSTTDSELSFPAKITRNQHKCFVQPEGVTTQIRADNASRLHQSASARASRVPRGEFVP